MIEETNEEYEYSSGEDCPCCWCGSCECLEDDLTCIGNDPTWRAPMFNEDDYKEPHEDCCWCGTCDHEYVH